MKVFLSWSGERSRAIAEALGSWLAQVIQAVEPWISSEMDKGARWPQEIAGRLEEARVGIICLTPENFQSPWLLFEAGALSKTRDTVVCTFLVGLSSSDVSWPLAQFQHTLADEADVRRLIQTINKAVAAAGERALADSTIAEIYSIFWPRLAEQLGEISERVISAPPIRSEREMLEELIALVRNQERHRRFEYRTRNLLPGTQDSLDKLAYDRNLSVTEYLRLVSEVEQLIEPEIREARDKLLKAWLEHHLAEPSDQPRNENQDIG